MASKGRKENKMKVVIYAEPSDGDEEGRYKKAIETDVIPYPGSGIAFNGNDLGWDVRVDRITYHYNEGRLSHIEIWLAGVTKKEPLKEAGFEWCRQKNIRLRNKEDK